MSKPYFRQVPNFEYVSRVKGEQYLNEYVTLKNLFKKAKLREDIFESLNYFERYAIKGDERPDNVAAKFYNDPTLDWVVLLSNNILNIQEEWPMTTQTFEKVMLEKYGSYETLQSGIHHYETLEIRNSLGLKVLQAGLKVSPTWKTNGNFIEGLNSAIVNISATDNGDGVTPSRTVTVFMANAIPDIQLGSQVTISGVPEREYNGQFVITEIYPNGFAYDLPSIPNVINPVLSTARTAQVIYNISENSLSTGNAYYYEYWDSGLGYSVLKPSTDFVIGITNYEYEIAQEDAKRNIYLLKPIYLNVIYNDLDELMPYKKGGAQYVNSTLKRADNIRLTS